MKRLALLIICSLCYVCECTVYAQDAVVVHLNYTDPGLIRPTHIETQIEVDGVAEFDYLKIESGDKFAAIKLGYDENAVFREIMDPKAEGYEFLEMTLKDLGGSTNWNKMWISYNEAYPAKAVAVGDYLANAEFLGDGWFKIKIPVADIKSGGLLSHLTFPSAFSANIGVKEITFTGENSSLQWFGSKKYDNAFKENQVGQGKLVFKSEGVVIDQMKLQLLTLGNELVQPSMPYHAQTATVVEGKNMLRGVVVDENGNTYYSDTVMLTVPRGLTYVVADVSCHGAADGSIDLTVEGGTPPYTYAWNNGASAEDISGLESGVYEVMVTDSMGRKADAAILVKQPNELTADLSQDHCYDTRALLSVAGGSAPYRYSIDGGEFISVGENEEEETWRVTTNQVDDEITYTNYSNGMETDASDNVYIVGNYGNVLPFGDGSVGEEGKTGNYLVKLNAAGEFEWGLYSIGLNSAYNWNNKVVDLAVDPAGKSVFIVDVKAGSVAFDQNTTLGVGSHLVYVDMDGHIQWSKSFGRGLSNVNVDAAGNIYVIGKQTYSSNTGTGNSDLFLIKYDHKGAMIWRREIQGKQNETNKDMYVDRGGDIYITGSFSADINFGNIYLQTTGREDAYVAKYNSKGYALWAEAGGSSNDDSGYTIVEDGDGNLFATISLTSPGGKFGGEQFDRSAQILFRLSALDGAVVWSRPYFQTGFLEPEEAFELVTLNGKVYLTAQGFYVIYREGEYFGPYLQDNLLFGFDYDDGTMLSLQRLGTYYYDAWRGSPLAVSSDNHLLYADYTGNFSIAKTGAPERQVIEMQPDYEYITVKDANNCEYVLSDLEYGNTPPAPPTLCYITSGSAGNMLYWSHPAVEDEDIATYNIYRETRMLDEMELVGTVDAPVSEFQDTTVNVFERSYRYAVTAVDGCGNESALSDPHQTMHLTVNEGNIGQINLIWDAYRGFDYKSFQIYRGSSPQDMELLAELPSYLFTYSDFDPSPLTLYYQIRIENEAGCGTASGTIATGRQAGSSTMVASNIAARFGQAGNLSFYPNPARDHISLKFSPDGDNYQLKVLDAGGRVVRTMENIFDSAVIERGNLPAGIYHIVLTKDSGEPLYGRIAFQ